MGSSSNTINFSVRQNKAIERSLVFAGLRRYTELVPLQDAVYVGLGSAWFVDFDQAHRELGIHTMISIEADDITFARAEFNRPFRTVELIHGASHDETPRLLERPGLSEKTWVVWLDYDAALDGTKLDELVRLVERLPENSALITTFNAHPRSYGDSNTQVLDELTSLFGDAFPSEDHPEGLGLANQSRVQRVLAQALLSRLDSAARQSARPGGFVPAFNIHYQDGAPMVTAGGFLPNSALASTVSEMVGSDDWRCFTKESINTPPLTLKEISALRALLPSDVAPTRSDLRSLGFDLREDHLTSFVRYYLDYPVYVQAAR